MREIIKKGNYTKIKIGIAIIVSILVAILVSHKLPNAFVWDQIPIISTVVFFVLLHLILDLTKMYEWIYKKRFILAILLLAYVTIMGYSGSSISMYNSSIQPEETQEYFTPILGIPRGIRSDEWAVNAPIFASQAKDKDNAFAYYNDNLRGIKTDMFSIINSPVKSILTLAKPFNIGYLLVGFERGLAFMWYGKIIALMLISFEFCMLLTDKKKLISLLGMILITFSAAVQWWNTTELMIWGMLAILCIHHFMLAERLKIKLLCAFGIFFSGICYIFIFYPAWQIPYGFIYLACIIWLWIKNKYKIKLKDIGMILLVIVAIGAMLLTYFSLSKESLHITMNTSYPGERFEIGGNGKATLFSYVFSILFPYHRMENPCELSGMTSYYPIPLIISLLYLIKSKDRKSHLAFYLPIIAVTILLSIFVLIPTNRLFAKITFLYMSVGSRAAIPLGLLQIMLLIYTMGRIKEKETLLGSTASALVAIVLSIVLFSISLRSIFGITIGSLDNYICGLLLFIVCYLMLTINKQKNQKYLIAILIFISLITGATVNPIQKNTSVLFEKPVAKKVQEIVKEDPENNLWITDNSPFYVSNYILANGAKVINSTNTYPNEVLYQEILGEEKANEEKVKDIYNRYSHMVMEIVKEESSVELIQSDYVKVKINVDDLKNLNITYILSNRELEEFNTEEVKFKPIYNEQGMLIYKVNKK